MKYLRYFAISLISIVFCWDDASAIDAALNKAVLTEDWQTVFDMVTDSTTKHDEIHKFLEIIACFALDFECSHDHKRIFIVRESSLKRIEVWIKAIRWENSHNAIPSYLLASLYDYLDSPLEALRELYVAVGIDDSIALIFMKRSQVYFDLGATDASLDYADRAIELDSTHSIFYSLRGALLESQEKHEAAANDYSNAIRLKPDRWINYLYRGDSYFNMECNVEAILDYTKAINLDSSLVSAYLNRASSYLNEAELDKALIDFHKVVALDTTVKRSLMTFALTQIEVIEQIKNNGTKDKLAILLELAVANLDQDNLDAVIATMNYVLSVDSTMSDAYYWRAFGYWQLTKDEQAIEDFNRAIHFHPNDTTAYFNRGALFEISDRHHDAINDYTAAIELDSLYVRAYENRAKSYEELGHVDSAISDYKALLNAVSKSGQGRRDDIEDLVEYLTNPTKKFDKNIKKVIKRAYKNLEKQEWAEFVKYVHNDDLESFHSAMMDYAEHLFGQSTDHVFVYGDYRRKSYYVDNSPNKTFELYMKMLAGDASSFKSLLQGKFGGVKDVTPRGANHAIVKLRIKGLGKDGKTEMIFDNNVERMSNGWKIRMPMFILAIVHNLSPGPLTLADRK